MCGIVKLHPARGRKRIVSSGIQPGHCIAIYPRKGTETCSLDHSCGNNSIVTYPRKGTEARRPKCKSRCMPIAIYPRKGTETRKLSLSYQSTLLQFIPARGQKSTSATGVCQQRRCFAFSYILFYRLGTAPAGIVFVTGSALTPCGTFRFKGRISCR